MATSAYASEAQFYCTATTQPPPPYDLCSLIHTQPHTHLYIDMHTHTHTTTHSNHHTPHPHTHTHTHTHAHTHTHTHTQKHTHTHIVKTTADFFGVSLCVWSFWFTKLVFFHTMVDYLVTTRLWSVVVSIWD